MKTLKLLIKSGFFDKTNVNGEQSTSEDSGSSHSPKSHWSDRLLVGIRIGVRVRVSISYRIITGPNSSLDQ